MCNDCEKDYETMALEYAESLAKLEDRIDALEKALSFATAFGRVLSDHNLQLLVSYTNLQKKVYYGQ